MSEYSVTIRELTRCDADDTARIEELMRESVCHLDRLEPSQFRSLALEAHKRQIAHKILANETYLPDSSVYRGLHRALMKLSRNDLFNLFMLIELKLSDMAEE